MMPMYANSDYDDAMLAVVNAGSLSRRLRTDVAILSDLSVVPLDTLDPDTVFDSMYSYDEILEIFWHPDAYKPEYNRTHNPK